MLQVGDRVRLREWREIGNCDGVPPGATGVVVMSDSTGVEVEMDEHHECLDDWENRCVFLREPRYCDPVAEEILEVVQ
ncbi:MAG: hypothetical protein JRI25_12160 [Deltaproteobacteria bacterium]|nr:hypothetical protein [Deltaproteobacteria bacterium]